MRKKNHPVLMTLAVLVLVAVLGLDGRLAPFTDHAGTETETEETTVTDSQTVVKAENTVAEAIETETETETEHVHNAGKAVRENQVNPTCTDKGSYDSVKYCTGCGEEMKRVSKTIKPLGHKYVDGVCQRCSSEDPDYRKIYTSDEIMSILSTHWVADSGGYNEYLNGESVSAFAEDHKNCFSLYMLVSYNLWGNEVQDVTYNIGELSSDYDNLFLSVAGETGSSGDITVEIYLDKSYDDDDVSPDVIKEIDASSAPTRIQIPIKNHQAMTIKTENHCGHENTLVFYDFSTEE